MKFLTAIVTVSLVIMITASAGYYFYNNSINESSYPSYHVDMYLNTTPYYPIHLNSNLTGNGTYQQLLTFSDPSIYGINSQGSNVLFYASNGTELYAWLQSINGTSASYWVKNYNGSSVIDMQVLPSFENLFSANGYLTEAPQLSSIYNEYPTNIFPFYSTFTGTALNTSKWNTSIISGNSLSVDNGLTMTGSGTYSFLMSKIAYNPQQYVANTFGYATSTSTEQGGNWGWIGNQNSDGNGSITQYLVNTYLVEYYSGLWNGNGGAGWFELSPLGDGSTTSPFISSVYINSTSVIASLNYGSFITNSAHFVGSSGLSVGVQQGAGVTVHIQYMFLSDVLANSMPTFTIGSGTNMTDHVDASYLSNSITIPIPNWFNLTLKAYTNYSFTFQYNNTPLYFTYDGLINNTIYTGFFDHNLTLDIHFIALGYSGKTQSIVLERG